MKRRILTAIRFARRYFQKEFTENFPLCLHEKQFPSLSKRRKLVMAKGGYDEERRLLEEFESRKVKQAVASQASIKLGLCIDLIEKLGVEGFQRVMKIANKTVRPISKENSKAILDELDILIESGRRYVL
jgi:hypothetical protein